MIVHVKVNKSTKFQQLNPICVTVSPEKVLKLIQFHIQTITTHVARCYCKFFYALWWYTISVSSKWAVLRLLIKARPSYCRTTSLIRDLCALGEKLD